MEEGARVEVLGMRGYGGHGRAGAGAEGGRGRGRGRRGAHLSRHCLPIRPGRYEAMTDHFIAPCCSTRSSTFRSSSSVQGPLVRLGFSTLFQRWRHCTCDLPGRYDAIIFQFRASCAATARLRLSSCGVGREVRVKVRVSKGLGRVARKMKDQDVEELKTNLVFSPLCLLLLEDCRSPDATCHDPGGPCLLVIPIGLFRLVVVAVFCLGVV